MADVFISYSRVDRDFVRRLHGALDSEDLEAWVDWQDIPVTAQWRSEIYAAIDGADTFVFVITPDSLASSVCQEELAHATAQSKRIVPIVWRRVDMDQMPHSLADINWLSMEQDAEFASAFSTLLEVLATDLDHVRAHTRVLVRAREWERNASDPSFLLRGTDLRDAETWISRRGAAEPAPNDLQVSYILASRRHAQLRQRFLLAGVCVALLITTSLAVVAYLQRERALEEAQVARSRELAALAMSAQDTDPERSLLLAIESIRLRPTRQAVSAVRRLMSASHLAAHLRGHEAPISAAVFSADGRYVISGSYDRSVRMWDVRNGKQVRQWTGHNETVDDVSISSDGRLVVSASRDGTIKLWRRDVDAPLKTLTAPGSSWMTDVWLSDDASVIATVADGQRISVLDTATGELRNSLQLRLGDKVVGKHWGAGGLLVAVVNFSRRPTVRLWHAGEDRVLATLIGHAAEVDQALFDASGDVVLTKGTDPVARLWDTATGKEIARYEGHEFGVTVAALSRDGRRVATNGPDHTVQIWDAISGARLTVARGHSNYLRAVAFSADGRRLVSAGEDGSARLWDTDTGQALAVFRGHGDAVASAIFGPDGAFVLTGSNDSTLRLWHVRAGAGRVLRRGGSGSPPEERMTRLSRDGQRLMIWTEDGSLQVEDVEGGAVRLRIPAPDGPQFASFSKSGLRLLTVSEEHGLDVWELSSGRRIGGVHDTEVSFGVAALDEQTSVLAVAAAGTSIALRTLDDSGETTVLSGHQGLVSGIEFDAAGRLLASSSWDATVRVWDRETAREKLVLATDQQPDGVVFSDDGSRVAAWSRGNLVRIWETGAGTEIATLRGHAGWVNRAVFAASAELIATASDDGSLKLWEVDSGQALMSVEPELGPFTDVALVDSRLLGATRSGAVLEVPCAVCAPPHLLADRACESVTRNLSADAWQQSFKPAPYARTCTGAPIHSSLFDAALDAARRGRLEDAKARLEEISSLDASAVNRVEKTRRAVLATAMLHEAGQHLANGHVKEAMDRLADIEANYPEHGVPADAWNSVCWTGALSSQVQEVLEVCDRAVDLLPDDEQGPVRDSRGIARARAGDSDGAIADFVAFLEWAEDDDVPEPTVRRRERWVETLRGGGDPFDSKTLEALQTEPY